MVLAGQLGFVPDGKKVVEVVVKGSEISVQCLAVWRTSPLRAWVVAAAVPNYILYFAFGGCFGFLVGYLFGWLNSG
jgi:hypothetical protein